MKKKALKVIKAKIKTTKNVFAKPIFHLRAFSHILNEKKKTYLSQWTVIEFNVDSVNNKLLVVIISISPLIMP